MCFSPQRCAILRHQDFGKCFGADVFWTFSLQNVLFATAACNFATSELQKVLRSWRVPNIFTSKCAFRHSGVQFCDIRTSKSASELTCSEHSHFKMCFSPQRRAIFDFSAEHLLPHRRFNRPTFRLTRHTNHWKNTAFRDFSNIWRGCIFFLRTFALLHLLSADLTTLLCFSTVHIVGSLLFKLPSMSFFMPSRSQLALRDLL